MAKNAQKLILTPEVQAAINAAVKAGLQAGRIQGTRLTDDPYKATERRLYAYTALKEKILADNEKIIRLRTEGTPERSLGIVRFSRPGYRVSPGEMVDAMVANIAANIVADTQEVEEIDAALSAIEGDEYADIIPWLYFLNMDIEEISEQLNCDKTTVFRNRKRLVNRISVRLYGADALR